MDDVTALYLARVAGERGQLGALERMLRRADGFRLAFALSIHPDLRQRLAEQVRRDLPDRRIVDVVLERGQAGGAVNAIREAGWDGPDAIFVHGLGPVGVLPLRPRAGRRAEQRVVRGRRLGLVGLAAERVARERLLRDPLDELDEREDDRAARAAILASLGDAAHMQHRKDDAIARYDRALALHRDMDNRLREANALTRLGEAARMQHHYDDAIAWYELALPLRRETREMIVAAAAGRPSAV